MVDRQPVSLMELVDQDDFVLLPRICREPVWLQSVHVALLTTVRVV